MIYVDLDDVVCETCDSLVAFARKHFDRDIAVEEMFDYDLRKSFNFDEPTYRTFMKRFHANELVDIPETPHACNVIRSWTAEGLNPVIVTGRPTYSNAATRQWLDEHGLADIRIVHVDKYAKLFNDADDPLITPFSDLQNMGIQFAIDDAPNAIHKICELRLCPTAIFTRPWNRTYIPPDCDLPKHEVACWHTIDTIVRNTLSH